MRPNSVLSLWLSTTIKSSLVSVCVKYMYSTRSSAIRSVCTLVMYHVEEAFLLRNWSTRWTRSTYVCEIHVFHSKHCNKKCLHPGDALCWGGILIEKLKILVAASVLPDKLFTIHLWNLQSAKYSVPMRLCTITRCFSAQVFYAEGTLVSTCVNWYPPAIRYCIVR